MTELTHNPLYILIVLSVVIVASEWLTRYGLFRHIGSALMVIMFGAILANLHVIPAGSTAQDPVPVYDVIFSTVAPISIFWLLLQVNLREVLKAGLPLVALFMVGAFGTLAGVLVGMRVVHGATSIGPLYRAVGGMYTGTYTGGSVNFNAVALSYDVVRDGVLYGGTIVVDNIITTWWIIATLAIPRAFGAWWIRTRRPRAVAPTISAQPIVDLAAETETMDPKALALVLAVGGLAQWLSVALEAWFAHHGITMPAILTITIFALALAQIPAVSRLAGARLLGMYAVYLFLTVIGCFCDVHAMARLGSVGVALLVFAFVAVSVHGIITFGTAWLFRMDLDGAAVASQANVGGSTSALALAKSLGREDLLAPGILLGVLGNGIGTFLGFLAVRLL